MDKKSITKSLIHQTGGCFPSITDIARYMGKGRGYVRNNVVNGLEYIGSETHKNFFVEDVAERIMEIRQV